MSTIMSTAYPPHHLLSMNAKSASFYHLYVAELRRITPFGKEMPERCFLRAGKTYVIGT